MKDVVCLEGEPAKFITKLTGKPTPTATWLREGQVIPQSGDFKVSPPVPPGSYHQGGDVQDISFFRGCEDAVDELCYVSGGVTAELQGSITTNCLLAFRDGLQANTSNINRNTKSTVQLQQNCNRIEIW